MARYGHSQPLVSVRKMSYSIEKVSELSHKTQFLFNIHIQSTFFCFLKLNTTTARQHFAGCTCILVMNLMHKLSTLKGLHSAQNIALPNDIIEPNASSINERVSDGPQVFVTDGGVP